MRLSPRYDGSAVVAFDGVTPDPSPALIRQRARFADALRRALERTMERSQPLRGVVGARRCRTPRERQPVLGVLDRGRAARRTDTCAGVVSIRSQYPRRWSKPVAAARRRSRSSSSWPPTGNWRRAVRTRRRAMVVDRGRGPARPCRAAGARFARALGLVDPRTRRVATARSRTGDRARRDPRLPGLRGRARARAPGDDRIYVAPAPWRSWHTTRRSSSP